MTTIAPVSNPPASNPSSQTDATSKTRVDYNSFLKLLVAELKNQDPTKPMESTDFVAQLATFSQVEQSVQSNAKLDQILQSNTLTQAGSLIGREITSADGKTSGIISQVKVYSDGLMAILKDGSQLVVGPGVTIKDASSQPAA
ncbi:flagellar hook assembly protein FlgD [Mesorhizobium sp. BAC0120]|uniref:flagellar hook assembly protein FlgD n=1 Tax=Mesorhizobium sp. BAC0120 TaxID=3090670 RepID=UPI00298D315B|nr:flagellar hook assembly protein FlgD [Mesorhizobium sp. BAC0120]MDW6024422.1 flagellar hook assembly protein FlgD [Mesorhizobium sp. BAC0120]